MFQRLSPSFKPCIKSLTHIRLLPSKYLSCTQNFLSTRFSKDCDFTHLLELKKPPSLCIFQLSPHFTVPLFTHLRDVQNHHIQFFFSHSLLTLCNWAFGPTRLIKSHFLRPSRRLHFAKSSWQVSGLFLGPSMASDC